MEVKNKILAVVVLYKERLLQTKTYISLDVAEKKMPKVWSLGLYVYDNSPEEQSIDENIAVKYIHNKNNPGLGLAYNSAADYATKNGFSWLLLLDQDTTLQDDFLEKTIKDIENNDQENLFAPTVKSQNNKLISPFRMMRKIGSRLRHEIYGSINIRKYAVINSGILVSVSTFNEVGGYNEMVKLDFSDTEFLDRFAKKYDTIFITKSTCIQQLSTFLTDTTKLQQRFIAFCQGAKACNKEDVFAELSYFYVVAKRAVSLLIQTKSLSFIKIFWINYVAR